MDKREETQEKGEQMRRIQGTGSIYFDKTLQKFRGYITVGYEGNVQVRKSVSGKTRKEVSDKLEELKRKYQAGFLDSANQTFGEFLEYWLEQWVNKENAKSTYASYKFACNNVLIPQLGNVLLNQLGPQHLLMAFNRTLEQGKGRTAELAYSVAHRALALAVRWKFIKDNPADLIDKPKYEKKEIVYWTPKQITKFLQVAKNSSHYALYTFLLTTGCRVGEAFALRWSDIDWDNKVVRIQRTVRKDEKGRYYFGEPKTVKSRRSIVLTELALFTLKQHRKEQLEHRLQLGELYKEQDLVFAAKNGNVLRHSNLRKAFIPLVEKAGLPKVTIHQLRHSVASALMAAGVDLKQISEVLGHSSIGITGDVYSHIDITMKQQTAEAMDSILKDAK